MATITPDKRTIEKLDAIAGEMKKQALWGKRGFRSAANRLAVDVLYQLVFHPTGNLDLADFGFVRQDGSTPQSKH